MLYNLIITLHHIRCISMMHTAFYSPISEIILGLMRFVSLSLFCLSVIKDISKIVICTNITSWNRHPNYTYHCRYGDDGCEL